METRVESWRSENTAPQQGMNTAVLEMLYHIRRKFKHGWTQGAMARDQYGDSCSVHSEDAVAWCYTGAARAFILGGCGEHIFEECSDRVDWYMMRAAFKMFPETKSLWGEHPTIINDGIMKSQKEALEWVDQAIVQAGKDKDA